LEGPWGDHGVGDWKLWGTHFGHFGAFGSREWREWDWAWGRIDGAHHLFNLLTAGCPKAADGSRRSQDGTPLEALRDRLLDAIERAESDRLSEPTRSKTLGELWIHRDSDSELLKEFRDKTGRDTVSQTADAVLRMLRDQDRTSAAGRHIRA
ncbi:MAG TPA: DUF3376 domain-containing protein, partial [Jiangellaceae bacterium]|nr:DUF3376 domain-containing protein [Jiangellaceae bacterium]